MRWSCATSVSSMIARSLFCRLVLNVNSRHIADAREQTAQAPPAPGGHDRRSLLATTTASSLNPTLACDGCPDTDTRVRVNDTTQYPWTAVGMVTRDQQGAISRSVCSSYLAQGCDALWPVNKKWSKQGSPGNLASSQMACWLQKDGCDKCVCVRLQ